MLFVTQTQATSVTYNLAKQCECPQLYTQYDCEYFEGYCSWNEYTLTCSTTSCSQIYYQGFCYIQLNCQWNSTTNQCEDFTSCDQLVGVTQYECFEQTQNCPTSNGTNCGGYNELLSSCSSISASYLCEGYFTENGVCLWDNGVCKEYTECSQLNFIGCTVSLFGIYACSWSPTTQKCVPQTCSRYPVQSDCLWTLQTLDLYPPIVQLCEWNNITHTCQNATSTSFLNSTTCIINTLGIYQWNPYFYQNGTGACVSCMAASTSASGSGNSSSSGSSSSNGSSTTNGSSSVSGLINGLGSGSNLLIVFVITTILIS